jgi:hypothetical protein
MGAIGCETVGRGGVSTAGGRLAGVGTAGVVVAPCSDKVAPGPRGCLAPVCIFRRAPRRRVDF